MKIGMGRTYDACLCRTCSKHRNIFGDRCRCEKAEEKIGLYCTSDEFISKCSEYEAMKSRASYEACELKHRMVPLSLL